jgi:anthranilate synthase component I
VGAAVLRDRATGRCRVMAREPAMLRAVETDLAAARSDGAAALAGARRTARRWRSQPSTFSRRCGGRASTSSPAIFSRPTCPANGAPLPPGADPAALYARLRRSNPGPFAGLARWQDACDAELIAGAAAEPRNGVVETRPIAGTRPRGVDAADDAALERELMAHPKERAEHVMLIDLERNDLGRICRPGSIEVNEMMVLESYAHVHHIVSNVRGELAAGVGPGAAIRAVFPGGTITGCPKVRCMQIIHELEQAPAAPTRARWAGWRGRLAGSQHPHPHHGNEPGRAAFPRRRGDRVRLGAGGGTCGDPRQGEGTARWRWRPPA